MAAVAGAGPVVNNTRLSGVEFDVAAPVPGVGPNPAPAIPFPVVTRCRGGSNHEDITVLVHVPIATFPAAWGLVPGPAYANFLIAVRTFLMEMFPGPAVAKTDGIHSMAFGVHTSSEAAAILHPPPPCVWPGVCPPAPVVGPGPPVQILLGHLQFSSQPALNVSKAPEDARGWATPLAAPPAANTYIKPRKLYQDMVPRSKP